MPCGFGGGGGWAPGRGRPAAWGPGGTHKFGLVKKTCRDGSVEGDQVTKAHQGSMASREAWGEQKTPRPGVGAGWKLQDQPCPLGPEVAHPAETPSPSLWVWITWKFIVILSEINAAKLCIEKLLKGNRGLLLLENP
jgi:hypothetical protein